MRTGCLGSHRLTMCMHADDRRFAAMFWLVVGLEILIVPLDSRRVSVRFESVMARSIARQCRDESAWTSRGREVLRRAGSKEEELPLPIVRHRILRGTITEHPSEVPEWQTARIRRSPRDPESGRSGLESVPRTSSESQATRSTAERS